MFRAKAERIEILYCCDMLLCEPVQLDRLNKLDDASKALVSALFEIVIMVHVLSLGVFPDTVGTDETVKVSILVRIES